MEQADPAERKNVIEEQPEVAERAPGARGGVPKDDAPRLGRRRPSTSSSTKQEAEQLRALGYAVP